MWIVIDGEDINLDNVTHIEYYDDREYESRRDKKYYIRFNFISGRSKEFKLRRKEFYDAEAILTRLNYL